MSQLPIYCLLLFISNVASNAIRDLPILNSTTSSFQHLDPPFPSQSRAFKPHLEASETGLIPEETALQRSGKESKLDIATIPRIIHIEATANGFSQDHTSPESTPTTASVSRKNTNSDIRRPRPEVTASGFDEDLVPSAITQIVTPIVTPPTLTIGTRVLEPTSVTGIQIGDKTILPGGETITLGVGPRETKLHVDPSGQMVAAIGSSTSTFTVSVTIGSQVATPIPSGLVVDGQSLTKGGPAITAGSTTFSINNAGETLAIAGSATSTIRLPVTQVNTFGDVTATAVVITNQYAVGSSTLGPYKPITIDGTVMSLTTNEAGSSVLVAGTLTRTLPARGISTTVISGTTQYIINGQTMFPGHPVTVNGVPMSIVITSGATILVAGEKTTTLSSPVPTPHLGPTTSLPAARPGSWATSTQVERAQTTSGAGQKLVRGMGVFGAALAVIDILGFG